MNVVAGRRQVGHPGSGAVRLWLILWAAVFALSLGCGPAALTGVTIVPVNLQLTPGATQQYVAVGQFSDGTSQDVTTQAMWSSSSPDVATINPGSGLAQALSEGLTTLSATVGTQSATTVLAVLNATVTQILVSPAALTLPVGNHQQFVATATYSDDTSEDITSLVTWGVAQSTVASIVTTGADKGLASGLSAGQTDVLASLAQLSGSASVQITEAKLVSLAITTAASKFAKGTQQQLTLTGTYSDQSTRDLTSQATWSSANSAVLVVSNASGTSGLASGESQGSATVTATLPAGMSAMTTVAVSDASLVSLKITLASTKLAQKTLMGVSVTGTYSDSSTQAVTGQVKWTSSKSAVADVATDLLTALAVGTTTLTAAIGTIKATAAVTVTAATLKSIAVTPAKPALSQGKIQQFTAKGTFSDGTIQTLNLQAIWTSDNPASVAISNSAGQSGLATALGVGSAVITASVLGVPGGTTVTVL